MNKVSSKQVAAVEHYAISVVVAGTAIYQGGNHDIKKVAWAALVGVLGPVLHTLWGKLKAQATK